MLVYVQLLMHFWQRVGKIWIFPAHFLHHTIQQVRNEVWKSGLRKNSEPHFQLWISATDFQPVDRLEIADEQSHWLFVQRKSSSLRVMQDLYLSLLGLKMFSLVTIVTFPST